MSAKQVLSVWSTLSGIQAELIKAVASDPMLKARMTVREVSKPSQLSGIVLADPSLIANNYKAIDHQSILWVQNTWAGVNPIVNYIRAQDQTASTPWPLARFGGKLHKPMAEYVLAQIISWTRNWRMTWEAQVRKEWCQDDRYPYRRLNELTIGILGFGDIGQEIGKTCKFFGSTVWGLQNSGTTKIPENLKNSVDRLVGNNDLKVILKHSDVVCNLLPSTPLTIGLFDKSDYLKECIGKKPLFINVGRGDVISEDNIIKALDKGWVSSIVADVFQTEPLPQTSKLWLHPKVTITPHVSAWNYSKDIVDCFIANLKRYLKGERLLYVVDWNKGY